MIDTEKQKGSAPFAKKAIEMVQSLLNFRLIDVEGHYWALLRQIHLPTARGACSDLLIHPREKHFSSQYIVNLKLDSAGFAVHMIVTLRICSIIDIMFNLTQMKMRVCGIDILSVVLTHTLVWTVSFPCTKDILRDFQLFLPIA